MISTLTRIVSRPLGCGSYLPKNVVTNDDLSKVLDTSNEWIVTRTGIRQRYIAADDEMTSDLATEAARRALDNAGIHANEVDLVLVATTTPDHTFPATATKVQARLGVTQGAAFDIQAVCSGFIYALSIANNFIRLEQSKTALIIGAETFSRILDWKDRTTCVLFGDGAGALVLRGEESKLSTSKTQQMNGIVSTHLHADGRHHDLLYMDGGPSSTQTIGHVRMLGKEVFRHAVDNLSSVIKETLNDNKLQETDIDWIVPHQANKRILNKIARNLKIDPHKIIITIDKHANTSAASVPLALDEAVRDGRIKRNDLLLLEAMGSGKTWGACLMRW